MSKIRNKSINLNLLNKCKRNRISKTQTFKFVCFEQNAPFTHLKLYLIISKTLESTLHLGTRSIHGIETATCKADFDQNP